MSSIGVGSSTPSLTTRMRPPFSAMNSRPLPSYAGTMSTGLSRPTGDGDERDRRRVRDDGVEEKRSEGEGEAKRHRGHGAPLPPAGARPFRSVSV